MMIMKAMAVMEKSSILRKQNLTWIQEMVIQEMVIQEMETQGMVMERMP